MLTQSFNYTRFVPDIEHKTLPLHSLAPQVLFYFYFLISAHVQAGPYVIKVICILLHLPQLCQQTHHNLVQQVQNCISKTDTKTRALQWPMNQIRSHWRWRISQWRPLKMTAGKQKKKIWQHVLDCYYEKLCERVDTDECCYYKHAAK